MELGMIGLGRMGANMTERFVLGVLFAVKTSFSRESQQRQFGW
ncbi:MAG: hypothetical protein ACREP5_14270 [Candidatus Binatia bacterium]